MKFETKGDPKKKVKTLVDAKQSSKSCHKGDAVKDKDKDLDVQVSYKETKTETRTYTQTDGFTFSGNLKGKNIHRMSLKRCLCSFGFSEEAVTSIDFFIK